MDIRLLLSPVQEVETDALIAIGLERVEGQPVPQPLADLNEASGGWVEEAYVSGEFTGKAYETAALYRPRGLRAKRLIAAGAGQPAAFNDEQARRAVATGVRTAKRLGARSIAVYAPSADAAAAGAAVQAAILGDWEPDKLKTSNDKKSLESCAVVVPGGSGDLQAALDRARIIAEAQNFTRDLQNEPPNRLPPLELAERARLMAAEVGLECEILDENRMRQIGMGSLLAVAQGSAQPPALIILRYRPQAGVTAGDHLGIIGKGVTFDTGGISIKPADNMDKMKYDMSGGAMMIGAMRALAQIKPSIPVTALIPTVENMPGGRAQRPGDIVKTLSGKTVEVLNTDAEGRLILNDAMTYARRLGCTHLVDAATLTGAIVIALGHIYVGVFSNHDAFRDKLLAAARRQGEKMWPMPLDEEYMELLKSPFADIGNIGGRWGGAITAAMFLKQFAEDTPWVHLDIAGTASYDDGKPYAAKGASGIGVRTIVDLAMNW
ncbi:MAG TPA: leucyl aminopeptidase [Bryobacteraceae bacterium]|nr:leucyl aminopeptidase [Bryobacteraceae bacterium]